MAAANGPTAVAESPAQPPRRDGFLGQNYPNPFNPTTLFEYRITKRQPVNLSIYDVAGRRIAALVDREQDAGSHRVFWYGLDHEGRPAASGIYFCLLNLSGRTEMRKVVLIR